MEYDFPLQRPCLTEEWSKFLNLHDLFKEKEDFLHTLDFIKQFINSLRAPTGGPSFVEVWGWLSDCLPAVDSCSHLEEEHSTHLLRSSISLIIFPNTSNLKCFIKNSTELSIEVCILGAQTWWRWWQLRTGAAVAVTTVNWVAAFECHRFHGQRNCVFQGDRTRCQTGACFAWRNHGYCYYEACGNSWWQLDKKWLHRFILTTNLPSEVCRAERELCSDWSRITSSTDVGTQL